MFNLLKKLRQKKNANLCPEDDYSHVDITRAEKMYRRKMLEKLYLIPLEYGGEDVDLNTLYVPLGVSTVKAEFDRFIVRPLLEIGDNALYEVIPQYEAQSCVPTNITINFGNLSTTINIWEKANLAGSDISTLSSPGSSPLSNRQDTLSKASRHV